MDELKEKRWDQVLEAFDYAIYEKTMSFSISPLIIVILSLSILLSGCTSSEDEMNTQLSAQLDEAYNEGWHRALDCVKDKGGSAYEAADECR